MHCVAMCTRLPTEYTTRREIIDFALTHTTAVQDTILEYRTLPLSLYYYTLRLIIYSILIGYSTSGCTSILMLCTLAVNIMEATL